MEALDKRFLLMTYMADEWRTSDFWASLIAGLALIGLVFFIGEAASVRAFALSWLTASIKPTAPARTRPA